jgi:hypothetical protein
MEDIMSSSILPMAALRSADRCAGSISALILRCADGEDTALGELFDRLYPFVLAIVNGGVPSAAADTLVVETFRRMWQHAPAYDQRRQGSIDWIAGHARAVAGLPAPYDYPLSRAAMEGLGGTVQPLRVGRTSWRCLSRDRRATR